MSEFLQFCLLGLGAGALYALSGLGLVVIYRGSGVLDFAQGTSAMSVVGGMVCYQAQADGLPYPLAVLIATVLTALLGALFHLLVLRGLRRSSAIMRLVATLAPLICLQGIATLKYGGQLLHSPTELPRSIVSFDGGVTVSLDRLILLAVVALATVVMWTVCRFSRFGISTSAVAENQTPAAATGLRPDRTAPISWAFGSALASIAGILIAPVMGLSVLLMTMVLASLAVRAAVQPRRRRPQGREPQVHGAHRLCRHGSRLSQGARWIARSGGTVDSPPAPVLSCRGLTAGYADVAVVRDLDLDVHPGQVVLPAGANGAGKTTTTMTLAGAVPPLGGSATFSGCRDRAGLDERTRAGTAYVPEERSVFRGLSCRDNLRIGTEEPDHALRLVPDLKPRLSVPGSQLSGGEQQMLSLGRARSTRPRLLPADELSFGLGRWSSGACCGRSVRPLTRAARCCWWNSTSAWRSASPIT